MRGSDVEFVSAEHDGVVFGETWEKTVEFLNHFFSFLVFSCKEQTGRVVCINLTERDFAGVLLNDVVEYLNMVVVGMRQEPCIDMRMIGAGHFLQIGEEILGFRVKSAVDHDDFIIFRGDDEAVADRVRDGSEHMDGVFHEASFRHNGYFGDGIIVNPKPAFVKRKEAICTGKVSGDSS